MRGTLTLFRRGDRKRKIDDVSNLVGAKQTRSLKNFGIFLSGYVEGKRTQALGTRNDDVRFSI
jgi:hypothetical protein